MQFTWSLLCRKPSLVENPKPPTFASRNSQTSCLLRGAQPAMHRHARWSSCIFHGLLIWKPWELFVIPKTKVSRVSDLRFQEHGYQQLLQAGEVNFIKGGRMKDNHVGYSWAIAWNRFSDMNVGKYWFKMLSLQLWMTMRWRVWNRCRTWTASSNW